MVENWLPLANVLGAAVLLGCYAVVLAVINSLAKGRARGFGVIGLAVMFLSTVLGALNGSLGPWLTYTYGTSIDFFGLGTITIAILRAGGVVLLVLAAVAARKAVKPLGGN